MVEWKQKSDTKKEKRARQMDTFVFAVMEYGKMTFESNFSTLLIQIVRVGSSQVQTKHLKLKS
jgi:hypothetical protein